MHIKSAFARALSISSIQLPPDARLVRSNHRTDFCSSARLRTEVSVPKGAEIKQVLNRDLLTFRILFSKALFASSDKYTKAGHLSEL